MTNEEIKTKEALAFLGYDCTREVTSKELYYSYIGLEARYNPAKCIKDEYKDGVAYNKLNEYYNYLSKNICRVNETIRNIIDPENKTFVYQEEKPIEAKPVVDDEPEVNQRPDLNNANSLNVMVADRPSFFGILMTLLVPIYGILNYFLIKKIKPRAGKWYLLTGIISMILNMLILLAI